MPTGNHHLLVGEDGLVALGRVLVAPHVLLAVDDDLERLALRRRLLVGRGEQRVGGDRVALGVDVGLGGILDAGQLDEGDGGDEDEDHRGADRPADLEPRVAVDLGRHAPAAGLELEHEPDQQALDPDEHDGRHDQDQQVQLGDVVRVGRRTVREEDEPGEDVDGG